MGCNLWERGRSLVVELSDILRKQGIDPTSLDMISLAADDVSIVTLTAEGPAILDLWQRLRGLVDEIGSWPLLLGDQELAIQLLRESELVERSPHDVLQAALRLDCRSSLEQRYEEAPEWRKKLWHSDDVEENGRGDADIAGPHRLLKVEPVYAQDDLNYLALVPTTQSCQAPAFLPGFGGANDCPNSEMHVAIAKYWQMRHGAEVLQILSDAIVLKVPQPVADRAVARELAREQLVYCNDIEEAATITGLADLLMQQTIWRFWWD